MGDLSNSQTSNVEGILESQTPASDEDVMKWHSDSHSSHKVGDKPSFIKDVFRAISFNKNEGTDASHRDHEPKAPTEKKSYGHWKHDNDKFTIAGPKLLSRTTSQVSPNFSKSSTPKVFIPSSTSICDDEFCISSPRLLLRATGQISPIPSPNSSKTSSRKITIPPSMDFQDDELNISSPTLVSRTTGRISPIPSPNTSKSSSSKIIVPPSLDFLDDQLNISSPTLMSCTTSRVSPTTSPNKSKSSSQTISSPPTDSHVPMLELSSGGISPTKIASPKPTTPIFFSQSAVRRKPEPLKKKLECTLEELCLGCVKKIKITRDAISSSGLIVQEEETLSIIVKPGWKRGTKIIFEGKGDERPGTLPADIIFEIDEKRHLMFARKGDDLELGVEVPLVQALTGCMIALPLLGGGRMNLSIEDIIYPGYEKIIPGQGMPHSKEQGRRGDLRLKFLVDFPDELSNEQRSEVCNILENCSWDH